MGSRRDYYEDPDAPKANSLKPGGSALVVDDVGRVLMQRRGDSGNWSLPGGIMEIGETLEQCVIRETKEETGLDIEITRLLGIYTDPAHVIEYADGEIRQEFAITYYGRVIGGEIEVSDESTAVRFISMGELSELPVHPTVRLRLQHHLEQRTQPYLG
ncbi:NUDIX domain-containing protein [Nocardia sp. 2]|uniref:NUDIX domain-containing protein n=1 Tax=Nocardia acididurans TaxID=2802282 RepID=A0ABS1LYG6_9NOCA|nr:NUDIX domain-containing protein [Nocardia acididurans]MBL1073447.1 NUDIX domain-containing protein [Nocardia acididurans]